MTPGQTALALYTCRTCGVELEYQGVGRPPVFCGPCRPKTFPPLKGRPATPQQLNGALSRRSDPPTSRVAAASVNARAVEARIIEAFKLFGWLTPFECADVLDDALESTVRTAVSRLVKAKVLVDTGQTRPNRRGRASTLYRLADS